MSHPRRFFAASKGGGAVSTPNIQFQKGMSLMEFLAKYGTESQCREALKHWRWPNGFACPRCGHTVGYSLRTRAVVQCGRCRKQTSLTANTLFHCTKLSLPQWFLALYLISQTKTGISTVELSRHLGVQQNTAWLVLHKIMQAMKNQEEQRRLGPFVEVDDAYLGGRAPGQKVGRGSPNKTAFLLAVSKNHKGHPVHVQLEVVKGFRRNLVERWARNHLQPDAHVRSDGLSAFRALETTAAIHQRLIVNGDNRMLDTAFFWSSTVLGNLKTSLQGVYHQIHRKYVPRFLALFQYRFNRRMDLKELAIGLMRLASRSCPLPLHQLRLAESAT